MGRPTHGTLIAAAMLSIGSAAAHDAGQHLDCIKEFRLTVAKGQLETMAKAAGGWSNLSPDERGFVGAKSLADAEKAVDMFQVHSSLARCREALVAIHRIVPPLTANERRKAGLMGKR
jgi:hypothetical protein